MAISEKFKSKKIRLGLAAIGVIVVGFIAFIFMNSGGTEMEPRKTRTAPRTLTKQVSKPKEEQPTKSPLFETLKKWKDPFRKEDPGLVELQDKIDATKKEIEYLKASLEEKQLRQEINELEKSISAGSEMPGKEIDLGSKEKKTISQRKMQVLAILISEEDKSALLVYQGKKGWVHEGEEFDGWNIIEIRKDSVVLLKAGKTYVFFYDRQSFSEEG
jgi:septal ring factor EnvC (AmiA/AmiB activator)